MRDFNYSNLINLSWDNEILGLVAQIHECAYVALYMLKTFIFNRYVYGYPLDTVGATMVRVVLLSVRPQSSAPQVAVMVAPSAE